MRLIYLADIHGAFERVKTLLSEAFADVYVMAGDLIDIPFYNMNTAVNYHELQSYFHGLRLKMNREVLGIEDFVEELLNSPDMPEEIVEKATRYQQYTIRARRVLHQKYQVLEDILSTKLYSEVFCIPGNYDMDLKYTALHRRNLHLRCHEVHGLKFAGYGGADIWTPGVPERYIVPYRAGSGVNYKDNEMYRFFQTAKPDIIVTHQPAHGIHDRITQFGTSGSPSLRHFCDNNPVLLCLTGHIHMDWGFQIAENTFYLNPSNFGEVTLLTGGVFEGGFFYSLDIEGREIKKITFKKIVDDRIYDIADYAGSNGAWEEKIIDRERYNALKLNENFDANIQKYSHIPEIELYNEIKRFFRTFQTEETEKRLDKLEQAARVIEERVHDNIGMDVIGSVNMGLCEETSDIDFVLYVRCDSDIDSCEQSLSAKQFIKEALRGKYDFQIMDTINLNVVEKSIRERNYDCEMTQLFVVYRALGRPINYRAIAPMEDLLNQDPEFRTEIEGSVRSYLRILINTSQHTRSFEKYEARLKSLGIKLPETIQSKIKTYLYRDDRSPLPNN
jgi:Icc-related predicted phosphoesterase